MQGGKKLNMRWSANKGFYVENLFSIQCDTFDDLMAVLEEGLSDRHIYSVLEQQPSVCVSFHVS